VVTRSHLQYRPVPARRYRFLQDSYQCAVTATTGLYPAKAETYAAESGGPPPKLQVTGRLG
jgi:hypothetical protein